MRRFSIFLLLVVFVCCLIGMRFFGLLGEMSLVVLFLAGSLMALFVYYSDRVKSISLKNGELVLSEIRKKHDDIIGVEANIRELASAVMAMSEANRSAGWAMGGDEYRKYVEAKNRLELLLR